MLQCEFRMVRADGARSREPGACVASAKNGIRMIGHALESARLLQKRPDFSSLSQCLHLVTAQASKPSSMLGFFFGPGHSVSARDPGEKSI